MKDETGSDNCARCGHARAWHSGHQCTDCDHADCNCTEFVSPHTRCGNCRFWNHNGDAPEFRDWTASEDSFDEFGDPPLLAPNKRNCLKILHGNGNTRDAMRGAAMITDGSGYSATFWTEPNFACSLFEPKAASKP